MIRSLISLATLGEMQEIFDLLVSARIGVVDGWRADVVVRASLEKDLAGCCALDFAEGTSILHSLTVVKSKRRMGIGSALVDYCIEIARDRGAEDVVLLTMFWNVNFFRKNGFSTTSRSLLSRSLANNPLIYDPALRRATPMIRHLAS
jgi:N-acetylglutamate synthase-like GNAT family acetyltransferase